MAKNKFCTIVDVVTSDVILVAGIALSLVSNDLAYKLSLS